MESLMNCGSCAHKEKGCKYESLKKCIDNDLWERDVTEIFKLVCSKYECKKNGKLKYGQKVLIKTRDELIGEGYEVTEDGVFKDTEMYLNQSDLEYLGWKMKIEFKDSEHYEDETLKGYSLTVANFVVCELDMCNVEPCMFRVLDKHKF